MTHHAILVRVGSVRHYVFGETEEAVEVQDSYNRPAEVAVQALVVRTDFITLEAQNALLKVLEEPPLSTRFVFVVPTDFFVLPTLTSRFNEEILSEVKAGETENTIFQSFIDAGYQERLASIEQAIKQKDVDWQRSMKQGLIRYVSCSLNEAASLEALEFATRMLLTRGASNKMLLEHVALILPTR